MDAESPLFPGTILAGLLREYLTRPSKARQCVDTLIRTDSKTLWDQGNRDLGTFSELSELERDQYDLNVGYKYADICCGL